MTIDTTHTHRQEASSTAVARRRRMAWLAIVISDAGLLAWGALAALAPQLLPGPGSTQILPAGYENFTGHSWPALVAASPGAASFIEVLFRLYGVYIVAFSIMAIAIANTAFRRAEPWAWWALLIGNTIAYGSAMTYDRIVGAIGPLEMSEYLFIGAIYAALAVTAPFGARATVGTSPVEPAKGRLELSAHMTVRPGCLEGFKKQAAELVRITKEKDSKTLRYDWFLSLDGTECEVREAYTGPEGLIEHNTHVIEARTRLFKDYADGHFMTVYGEPDEPLLKLLKAHVGFKWFSFLRGLQPSAETPAR